MKIVVLKDMEKQKLLNDISYYITKNHSLEKKKGFNDFYKINSNVYYPFPKDKRIDNICGIFKDNAGNLCGLLKGSKGKSVKLDSLGLQELKLIMINMMQ